MHVGMCCSVPFSGNSVLKQTQLNFLQRLNSLNECGSPWGESARFYTEIMHICWGNLHLFTKKMLFTMNYATLHPKKCCSVLRNDAFCRDNLDTLIGFNHFVLQRHQGKNPACIEIIFPCAKKMYYRHFPLASWGDSASQHPAISCATFRAFTVPLKFGARSQGWTFWCCHSWFKPMYLCMPRTKKYTMQSNHIKLNPMLMSRNRVSCLPF